MSTTVAIVQRQLVHYRVPLFEHLQRQLQPRGIALRVLHGVASAAEQSRHEAARLDFAELLPTRYLAGGRLCWQPFAERTRDCALLVVGQENKLLHNLPLLLRPPRHQRLAFWGHGADLEATRPLPWRERFKQHLVGRVDWWFAYSALSAERVAGSSFPPARITVLDNSTDTLALQLQLAQQRSLGRAALRHRLGLSAEGGPLAVMLGALTPNKGLQLALPLPSLVRARLPGFQLLIAGGGPLAGQAAAAAAADPSVVYLGPVHGERKAALLACADLMICPGALSLGVLDAFAAGLPLLATHAALGRSPESAYIEAGVNAQLCAADAPSLAAACVQLLTDPLQAQALAAGAARGAGHYTIDNMAARFALGIEQALQAPPWVARW